MRLERRVERIEHRGLSRQDDDDGCQGAERPRSRTMTHAVRRIASAAPERVLGDDVAEAHDEECREHERHQRAVRRDRHVVHRRADRNGRSRFARESACMMAIADATPNAATATPILRDAGADADAEASGASVRRRVVRFHQCS